MASKATAIAELQKIQSHKPRGGKCTAGLVYKILRANDQAALLGALRDQTIDSSTISVWLDRRGYRVRRHTVARHRRGECACSE